MSLRNTFTVSNVLPFRVSLSEYLLLELKYRHDPSAESEAQPAKDSLSIKSKAAAGSQAAGCLVRLTGHALSNQQTLRP